MKSTTASLMYIYLAAKNIYQACKLNDSLHSIHYDKNGVPQIHACKRLRLSKVGVAPKIFLRIFLLWIFFVLSLATLHVCIYCTCMYIHVHVYTSSDVWQIIKRYISILCVTCIYMYNNHLVCCIDTRIIL